MTSTTKYTPASQRDSLDESSRYTQAPPAYDDEPTPSHDQDALLGGPRGDDDNIPDDFKVWKYPKNEKMSLLGLWVSANN